MNTSLFLLQEILSVCATKKKTPYLFDLCQVRLTAKLSLNKSEEKQYLDGELEFNLKETSCGIWLFLQVYQMSALCSRSESQCQICTSLLPAHLAPTRTCAHTHTQVLFKKKSEFSFLSIA